MKSSTFANKILVISCWKYACIWNWVQDFIVLGIKQYIFFFKICLGLWLDIILLVKCQVFFTLDSNSLYLHIQGFNSKIGGYFIVHRRLYYDEAPNGILKSLSSLIAYKKFFLNYNKNDRRVIVISLSSAVTGKCQQRRFYWTWK